jgi:hypothetical protein
MESPRLIDHSVRLYLVVQIGDPIPQKRAHGRQRVA